MSRCHPPLPLSTAWRVTGQLYFTVRKSLYETSVGSLFGWLVGVHFLGILGLMGQNL